MSNEKRAPGWLGYIEDYVTTQLYRDYFISHEIRIPIFTNQDFSWNVSQGFGSRCSNDASVLGTLRKFCLGKYGCQPKNRGNTPKMDGL